MERFFSKHAGVDYVIGESTRQLDLYDFFSVLIPGSVFTIGVLPFLPAGVVIPGVSGLVIILLVGFVFGRSIHALGIQIESWDYPTSHREYFQDQVVNATEVPRSLVDKFYDRGRLYFGINGLPHDREDLKIGPDGSGHKESLKIFYGSVRSQIHMDSRGRSRTFQAVLDFYRGMMVAVLLLLALYLIYAFTLFFPDQIDVFVPYNSYLGTYDVNPGFIFFMSIAIGASAYTTFERVRSKYRRYYIEYLMIDFLFLLGQEE